MSAAITAIASALGIVASGYAIVRVRHWAERRAFRKQVEERQRARRLV